MILWIYACAWRRSGIFIVNFAHISHLALVFLLLTLNMSLPAEEKLKSKLPLLILLLKEGSKFLLTFPIIMIQHTEGEENKSGSWF